MAGLSFALSSSFSSQDRQYIYHLGADFLQNKIKAQRHRQARSFLQTQGPKRSIKPARCPALEWE